MELTEKSEGQEPGERGPRGSFRAFTLRVGCTAWWGYQAAPWDCRWLESGPLGPWQMWSWQWASSRDPYSPSSRLHPGPHSASSLPRLAWGLGCLIRAWFVL